MSDDALTQIMAGAPQEFLDACCHDFALSCKWETRKAADGRVALTSKFHVEGAGLASYGRRGLHCNAAIVEAEDGTASAAISWTPGSGASPVAVTSEYTSVEAGRQQFADLAIEFCRSVEEWCRNHNSAGGVAVGVTSMRSM